MWDNLPEGDIRNTVKFLMKNEKNCTTFVSYEIFLAKTNLKDCIVSRNFYHECNHVFFMYIMKWAGKWEVSWDIFDDDNIDLYPIKLVVVVKSECDHSNFPQLLCELGLFKSAKDAKNNGWNKPIEFGDFFFKKKTYILRIV